MSKNLLLIAIFLLITALPLFIHSTSEFAGTDGQAQEAIEAINPSYTPWANFVWEPGSGEVESFLFASQAAVGAGVIGYFLGLSRGRRNNKKERE